MISRIQRNLEDIRASLFKSITALMNRGETTEVLLEKAIVIRESSQLFEEMAEKMEPKSCWQRHCSKGKWMNWVFPCLPLCRWILKRTEDTRRRTHCCWF